MRIFLWHGYLLGGTGSNVYTRALAREWSRAGHDVTVFSQEPHPELHDLGGARVARLAFHDCRIETLTLSGAKLAHVDLRGAELSRIVSVAGLAGAWISDTQLADLAPLLASELQIGVVGSA